MLRIARYLSFLHSVAGPLLDLYLFVSSENYHAATSSAYTAVLPWLSNYMIPPKRRNLARARTAHLGLSSLDVAEASEHMRGPGAGTASSEYEAAKMAAGIPTDSEPKALSMGRGKGLGGLLNSPIYAARFKLDALSNELLEPLSDLLQKKDYLLEGDKPSSLDCLAFGYLSLMFYPTVPQAWLKETTQTKFPRISRYIQRLRKEFFGGEEVNSAGSETSICEALAVRLFVFPRGGLKQATHLLSDAHPFPGLDCVHERQDAAAVDRDGLRIKHSNGPYAHVPLTAAGFWVSEVRVVAASYFTACDDALRSSEMRRM